MDSQLLFYPVVSLWRWDGKSWMPPEIWDRVALIRDVVLQTIEDLARTRTTTYSRTSEGRAGRGIEFQATPVASSKACFSVPASVPTCDIDVQVSLIKRGQDHAPKGRDPDGYRGA